MKRDQQLEQLLRDMAKVDIPKPKDLGSRTIQRMHSASSPPSIVGRRGRIARNFGIAAAASFLLLAGFISTWGALTWWSNNPGPGVAGSEVDLTLDARIVDAQQRSPFNLALPTWLPKGYSLDHVEIDSPGSNEQMLTLYFEGTGNSEPLVISQSLVLEELIPADMQFVQIGSREYGYTVASNYSPWGFGPRSDLGYYFESSEDGFPSSHTMIFIYSTGTYGELHQNTYVTITSGDLATAEILELVKGINQTDIAELIPPDTEIDQRTAVRGLITPTHIPRGFEFSGMNLSVGIDRQRRFYSGSVDYTAPNSDFIRVRQWPSQQPQQSETGEEVRLINAVGTMNGYYGIKDSIQVLYFMFESANSYINFEISTDSSSLVKADLIAVADSITDQNRRSPYPSIELSRTYVPPTTHLSFGPDDTTFVGYAAPGNVADIWIDNGRYELPGDRNREYGPVWWHGDKIVYHVEGLGENPAGSFYVYNTRNQSHLSFEGSADWGAGTKSPVMLDDDTVAVMAPGGLWTHSISAGHWKLALKIDHYLKEVSWSPDTRKIAWIAPGAEEKLVVLDIATEVQTVVSQGEEILELAWSWDSSQLAAVTADRIGIIWNGNISTFSVNTFIDSLCWVPGKEILAYQEQQGLAMNHVNNGNVFNTNIILGDYSNHTWLPNGNLALINGNNTDGAMNEVTIFGWK